MSNNGGSSSDGSMPRGLAPKRRRGWEGEALELERDDAPASGKETHAAVDLQQFRNTEVGKGYQAKHVVRQRTGIPPAKSEDAVQDMTIASGAPDTAADGHSTKKERSKKSSSRKSKKRKKRDSSPAPKDKDYDGKKRDRSSSSKRNSKSERLEKYLKCEGLRNFRKEIESIVKES